MLIGEIVNKTGLSRDTIRFYEKKGLIHIERKQRRDNNYKEYSENILQKLLVVKRLKNFGFTLNEISDLLDMIDMNQATCTNLSHKISEKVSLLDEKQRELIKIRSMLLQAAQKCQNGCTPEKPEDICEILITDKYTV